MTQEAFPEIQAVTEALQKRIAITEGEIAQMKERVRAQKQLVRSWRKAISAVTPQPVTKKRKSAAS